MTATVDGAAGDRAPAASGAATRWLGATYLGPVIIAVLIIDALITLALEVLYLPTYIGTVAFPLSAVLAGFVNVLLVMGVRAATTRTGFAILPLAAWTFGFLICSTSGPGGDIMLGSDWRTVLLLVCGLVPPLLYMYIKANSGAFSTR
ncbi:hypothetical protein [Nocardia australiensis]|uniref:hypothetical protein n=1 Tax=Nocardia australiensis TaxID=2887191 RepID=UPI001D15ABF6|nr:hypothetical protein [Nocardia australiensis]